jgi:hypothetical protein
MHSKTIFKGKFMDEKILLSVWPEYGSTGIWMPPKAGAQLVGPNVSYESLNLPPDLINDFTEWQDIFTKQVLPDDDSIDWEAFDAKGLELAKRLKINLFYKADIEYEFNGIQKIYGFMVMADYSASLWDDEGASSILDDIEDDLNGYIIDDKETLQEEFDRWETEFNKSLNNTLDWEVFNKEGRRLSSELQSRLPQFCVVGYCHAFEETYPPFKAAPTTA